ncbi:hypothetical protein ACFPM3_00260 [Streptomyces coeruleoprunus]|uniref:Integral membrane protein n=1 Tax=Streptomyces coeruleoprunus TaxID=285563 RepID=A0ABV9X784_9ACTN
MSAGRFGAGAVGVGLMGYGVWLLVGTGSARDVVLWLAGSLLAHDAVVAPLVLGVGLLVGAVPARGVVRGALVVAGAVTLVALPVLLAPRPRANPSVLPLPYERNWLVVVGVVVGCAGALVAVRWLRRRAHPRRR